MPAPDVRYYLDCSLECGHISGDTHFYFMEVAVDSNEVLDAYDEEGQTFHKHWSGLADTGHYMERNFLKWRASNESDPLKKQSASFMGLWAARPLVENIVQNAADVAASAGHDRWNTEAHALLNREFSFDNSVNVARRSLKRAASDFDGWSVGDLIDMRRAVERVQYQNTMEQAEAIRRIRGLVDAGWEEVSDYRLSTISSQKDINRTRKMLAEKRKRERGVIKRSARFLSKLIGAETTRLYVGGAAVRIEGRHAIYELKKRSTLMDPHGGFAALSVFHKDHPDLHLCDLCIYTSGVPLLDHVASLVMHIQTGHEEDILSIGNASNCSDAAYEQPWLEPHLPSRRYGGEFGLTDLTTIFPARPWEIPNVKEKRKKTARIVRDLRRYIYEEMLQEHQKLLSGVRQAIGQQAIANNFPIYVENYRGLPAPTSTEEPDTDWVD